MPHNHPDRLQIVRLLRTGDETNKALAMQLALAIGWDIAQELQLEAWAALPAGLMNGDFWEGLHLQWFYWTQEEILLRLLYNAAPYLHYLRSLSLIQLPYWSDRKGKRPKIAAEALLKMPAHSLQNLTLTGFSLKKEMGEAIWRMPALQRLSLNKVYIDATFWQHLRPEASILEILRIEDPEWADKDSLPEILGDLPNLHRIISPDWLHWQRLPAWAGRFAPRKIAARLPRIYRERSEQMLPKGLEHLSQLKVLHLSEIPAPLRRRKRPNELTMEGLRSIGSLKNLHTLGLQRLRWRDLPAWLLGMQHLRWLNLSQNALREFPRDFTRLHTLLLNGNKGINFDENCCDNAERIEHLRRLELSQCGLERLPENIGNLRNLRILRLRSNELQSLPDSMKKLEKLEILDISGAKMPCFDNLAPLFAHWKCLRMLVLNPSQWECLDWIIPVERMKLLVSRR